MSDLLYIQASPRGERSKSITVADAFLEVYKQKNPSEDIKTLDLFKEDLPTFDGLAVTAKYTILHGQKHSQQEAQAWKKIEQVIEPFVSADKYLLAWPMWNFSVPYRFKQYIDIIVQPGYTFSYSNESGYQGLVTGKRLMVIYSRGGEYAEGSDAEAFDMQKKYIELIFGFMGFTNIDSIIIEPTIQAGPQTAKVKTEQAIEAAKNKALIF